MIVYRDKYTDEFGYFRYTVKVDVVQEELNLWERIKAVFTGRLPEIRVYREERYPEDEMSLAYPEFLFGSETPGALLGAPKPLNEIAGTAPLPREERLANAKKQGISYNVDLARDQVLSMLTPNVDPQVVYSTPVIKEGN